ncbi:hypothetical protein DM40_1631 [Burkholderia cenocepacia]|nr:hypothetical protein DM40_1631 [Burkholderia cenocepacia]
MAQTRAAHGSIAVRIAYRAAGESAPCNTAAQRAMAAPP